MALQTDLDPIFLKAVSLLHSPAPDAVAKLKALVEDERCRRRGETKGEKTKLSDKKDIKTEQIESSTELSATTIAVTSDSKIVLVGSSSSLDVSEVKPIDTITKTTAFELVETVEELSSSSFTEDDNKVTEIGAGSVVLHKDIDFDEVIQELDSSSYLEPAKKKPKVEPDEEWVDEEILSEAKPSLIPEPSRSLIKMQCVTCKVEETESSPDNIFVECHECHSHFHQKCHKPPISNKDVNDPRLIFYCITCTRQMRKEMAAQLQQSSSSKIKQPSMASSRPVANPFQLPRQSIQPFRRPSTSSSTSTNSGSGSTEASKIQSSPTAPARSQSPTQGASSGQRSSSSFRVVLPQDAALKSLKRLENLKKKAKIQQQMRTKR